MTSRLCVVLSLALTGPCFGQETTFKTQAPLVVVPVGVSTKTGERVWNLEAKDFQLLDNGQERAITVEPWGTYQSKISLVVVVQTTTFSKAALLKVKKIPSMLDGITGEGGEVALITADSDVEAKLPFTQTWEDIQEAFEKLHGSGGNLGRVLDGVDAAITMLSTKPVGQRRIILVLSEARDRWSKIKSSDVLTHAQQQNVTIYTASYSAYITPFTTKASELQSRRSELEPEMAGMDLGALLLEIVQATKQNMSKTLARYTGGRELGFNTLHGLEEDLTEIGKEVHSQYQITFVPPSEATAVYHEIVVKLREHPDVVIRARPGYWTGQAR